MAEWVIPVTRVFVYLAVLITLWCAAAEYRRGARGRDLYVCTNLPAGLAVMATGLVMHADLFWWGMAMSFAFLLLGLSLGVYLDGAPTRKDGQDPGGEDAQAARPGTQT